MVANAYPMRLAWAKLFEFLETGLQDRHVPVFFYDGHLDRESQVNHQTRPQQLQRSNIQLPLWSLYWNPKKVHIYEYLLLSYVGRWQFRELFGLLKAPSATWVRLSGQCTVHECSRINVNLETSLDARRVELTNMMAEGVLMADLCHSAGSQLFSLPMEHSRPC